MRLVRRVMLLPGLDGTGALFRRFADACPADVTATAMEFPRDRILTYAQLADLLRPELPTGPFVLLGESFSGPLALRLACMVEPVAVVLCATFVRAPAPRGVGLLPMAFLVKSRAAVTAARLMLAGGDGDLARDLVSAVAGVEPEVVTSRIRMVLEADAADDLVACRAPVLYIRGTRDRLVTVRHVERIQRLRPDVERRDVEAPHLVLQAKPRDSWDCIHRFIERVMSPD